MKHVSPTLRNKIMDIAPVAKEIPVEPPSAEVVPVEPHRRHLKFLLRCPFLELGEGPGVAAGPAPARGNSPSICKSYIGR